MDNDERERRDLPADERGDHPPESDPATSRDPSRPSPVEETAPEVSSSTDAWAGQAGTSPEQPDQGSGEPAPAEVESWPSQEWQPASSDETRQWPTEPPTAGGAPDDAWPAAASERTEAASQPEWSSDAARAEPSASREDRAPEEVEAYPAETASRSPDEDAVAATVAPAHAVPDAPGTTGESTQCPRCGTENRPGLSFCRNCGQRLVAAGVSSTVERPGTPEGTQACPRCGTHNRAGVAFCQNCGANLRGTAEGYVPPAAAVEDREAAAEPARRRGAALGPVVLLIGLAGLVTGYLLPFLYGPGNSLFERAWGADGYGIAFWNGYPDVGASLADQAYFGLAAPVPILGLLLLVLAVAGFVRAAPGPAQMVGLIVALLWSVGLIVVFVMVELMGNAGGDIVTVLRELSPAGIIFFLSSLIVVIGTLTRFSRG
ncbi:MAG: zinc ribbon domain-containing protein [Chloroflexi bacterium]|nr:zinc ribbon domain-containing protein [Chloroflexota bacterium]